MTGGAGAGCGTHGDERALTNANGLIIPWITAVLRQRLPLNGATLRRVTDGSAWLGNNQTGEVRHSARFRIEARGELVA